MRDGSKLYPRFSQAEYDRRYLALRQIAAGVDARATIVYGTSGAQLPLNYVANLLPRHPHFFVLPEQGEPTLFVTLYNHQPNAGEMAVVRDIRFGGATPGEPVIDHLKELGLDRASIAVVGQLPFQEMNRLQRGLPQATFVDVSGEFQNLRVDKSDEEIEWMRKAAALTDLAMVALEQNVRPGLTEHQVGNIIESAYVPIGGFTQIHFLATTSMHQPEVCVPAQWETARVLEKGDVLITEISASHWGYAGQIHRPYAIGEEPTPAYRRLFDTAVDAFERVKAVLKPGATARDVLDAADFIDRSEYTIYDDLFHGYGGGYLPPVLRTRKTALEPVPDFVFRENVCVVIQPNLITPDERMGLQVGCALRITANGVEELHKYPMQFTVIR